MNCTFCKNGLTTQELIHFSIHRDEKIIVFKNVQADVCDTCGEQFLSRETLIMLEVRIEETVSNQTELEVLNMAI